MDIQPPSSSRSRRRLRGGLKAGAVVALAAGMVASGASLASAATTISHGDANLISGSVLGTTIGSIGAVDATNSGQAPLVTSGAEGGVTIPGPIGQILTLQGFGRYADASVDGSSDAYAGGVTASGAPGSSAAQFNIKPSTVGLPDVFTVQFNVGQFSSEAHLAADGTPTSSSTVSDINAVIGGTAVDALRAPLTLLQTAYNTLGALVPGLTPFTSPVGPNGITIGQDQFLNAMGVPSWEQVPPNTDLVKLLPQLMADKVNSGIATMLAPAIAAVNALPFPLNVAAKAALATLQAAAKTVTDLAATSFSSVASVIGSFVLKPSATNSNGSYTQSAIKASLFPGLSGGAMAISLANATVGPNTVVPTPSGPMISPTVLGIGGASLIALFGMLLIVRRRQSAVAVSATDVR
ncbi:hypothetical protein FHU41_000903 [Psychromicrobium silvestre]|uniref:Uncharacterized protein n=1 Tax=Psychromicrobium silvestre TaxID=1645614 RepID=A0A7Y9LSC2_9MICC|nr:hypothetical protein [Psychromicrobium silvestre]NYE94682.1 hypothetical protein [Psychromicrobium silvestre]